MVVTHQLVKFFLKLMGPWAEVHDLIYKLLLDSPTWCWSPSERQGASGWALHHIRCLGVNYDNPNPWHSLRTNFAGEIPDEFDFSYPTEGDFAEDDEESIETVVRSESMEAVVPSDVSVSSDSHSENEIAGGRRLTRGQRKRRRNRFHPEGR